MEEKINLQKILNEIDNIINETKKQNELTTKRTDELKAYFRQNDGKLSDDEILNIFGQTDTMFSGIEDGLRSIKKLESLKSNPYFGKLTYVEDGEKCDTYVGLADVISTSGESLISDWRAPISSLFYNSNLGKTTYSTRENEFEVDLIGKKQISIKNGKLIYCYEADERINDEILINVLRSQKASEKMKNIVSSIQSEQNAIIREPSFFSIIINGVAGSGKTSIAMHRLAYLLYSEKEKLKNENILIISPNELFSKYISTLLPELGEENALTISFKTLLSDSFNILIHSETRAQMLEDIFVNNKDRLKEIQFKYSKEYVDLLLNYLGSIDIEKEVGNLYLPNKRINLSTLDKKYALSKENNFRIYRKIDYLLDEIILEHFRKMPEEKQNEIREELKQQILDKLLKKNHFLEFLKSNGIDKNENFEYSYDEIPTYAFINFAINGFDTKSQYKEIFIDEIQDYDALSLKMLKELFPEAKFVIVGDTNQNLISVENNLEYLKSLLPLSKSFELSTCYRSTVEISNLANAIINYEHNGKIIRNGKQPTLHITDDLEEKIKSLTSITDDDTKIAIICKTKKEALMLHSKLNDFGLIDDESIKIGEVNKNKIITTIHLSKGLEFDRVIIPFVESGNFETEEELQLLYVMTTRALHEVDFVLEKGKTSILLDKKFENLLKMQNN